MMQHGSGHVLQRKSSCEVLAHGHVDPEHLRALNIEFTAHRVRLAEPGERDTLHVALAYRPREHHGT